MISRTVAPNYFAYNFVRLTVHCAPVRIVIAVMFWVGLFLTVREWLYARKHGLTITLTERLYLALALPLVFTAHLVLDLLGIAPTMAVSVLAIGVAFNGWAIKRRVQRTSSK